MTLYSASYDKAMRLEVAGTYFFERQLLFALVGLLGASIIIIMPFSWIQACIPLLLLVSFLFMGLTSFTPMGVTRLGARRWLQLGPMSFQPSELLKVSVILYLANYLSSEKKDLSSFWTSSIPVGVVFFSAGLILLQRDYSTTMVFLFLSFSMLITARIRISYLLYYLTLSGIPGILFLITEEYRLKRVIGFLFKDIDPSGMNYQVNISLDAISSGGLWGSGFGQGIYKLGKIPEVQSDFIFAAFAEESGLFGVLIIMVFFAFVAIIGFRGSGRHREDHMFLYLAGFGITYLLIWQVMLNMGVVSGIVPPTGIPLPFFSAGGTNLLMNLGMCGLLCKIIMFTEHKEDAFGRSQKEDHSYRGDIRDYE